MKRENFLKNKKKADTLRSTKERERKGSHEFKFLKLKLHQKRSFFGTLDDD